MTPILQTSCVFRNSNEGNVVCDKHDLKKDIYGAGIHHLFLYLRLN